MNFEEIFKLGRYSFKSHLNVFDVNPYNIMEDRGMNIAALQPEATPFFNGWESARKEREKKDGYSLFLDDFRFPSHVTWVYLPLSDNWIITRHSQEFIDIIEKNGLPRFISFDFDLDRHGLTLNKGVLYLTGAETAKWLGEYCIKNQLDLPRYAIHSTNKDGYEQIAKILKNYRYNIFWNKK